MIISEQDQNIILQDTVRISQDTTIIKATAPADSAILADKVRSISTGQKIPVNITAVADTVSVSKRHPFGEIIYPDSSGADISFFSDHSIFFPFSFIGKSESKEYQKTGGITTGLHEGRLIDPQPFNDDWIIIIVLVSAFIYSTLSAIPGRLFHNAKTFLLFKGIGDPSSRERGNFFQWQTILINIVSFSGAALFAYCTADYFHFYPFGISGILLWFIFLGLILMADLIRIVICILLGSITGESAVFSEYCSTVSHSYHITGFILFLITVLVVYSTFPSPQILLYSGLFAVLAAYFMRVLRLFFIFLKRNISIFYLILYLCALEFLPALVVLKYLTDLF
jgi:hypothetical protein